MREKIVYEAFDGFVFETAEKCQQHEKERGLIMYNVYGEVVNDARMAQFVYLHDETSADKFIALVEYPEDARGIAAGDIGLFSWDIDYEEYRQIVVSQLHVINQLVGKLF